METDQTLQKDITSHEDIKLMVDTFYGKVRNNALLGPIFNGVIGDNWEVHLEKMYRFWGTILLEEASYNGRPFPPHAKLPVEKQHFETWFSIFEATVDELFKGSKADEAKWRAARMAEMFHYKISHLKGNLV